MSVQHRAERFDARREQLAESALRTLAERGYAQTSLRDIAHNSPFTHGVVHYYFRDKAELIGHCVRTFKRRCAARFDDIVATASAADEFAERFTSRLAETLVGDAAIHRLWYDLRSQALFDPALRDDVTAIDDELGQTTWRIVARYGELSGRQVVVEPALAYAAFDGLFERALLEHTGGEPNTPTVLTARSTTLLHLLVPPVATSPAA